jgi:tellurite methyltransferase
VIARIPRGKVMTYGAVAEAAGYPRAARLTVRALYHADGLPWHRVVGAGGRVALPGSSGAEQRLRLRSEGVEFRGGRVRLDRHGWTPPRARPAPVDLAVDSLTGYRGRFDVIGWPLIGRLRRYKRTLVPKSPSLLDLGMGRGRDMIYFVRCGYRVAGIDIDPIGIAKAKARAKRMGLRIRTQVGDLRRVAPVGPFDVVFSSTFVNDLPPSIRKGRFRRFQAITKPGGIHAVNAFIDVPNLGAIPDLDPEATPFAPGELGRYYAGWGILETSQMSFDCSFTGIPHRHVVEVVVARKPVGGSRRTAHSPGESD